MPGRVVQPNGAGPYEGSETTETAGHGSAVEPTSGGIGQRGLMLESSFFPLAPRLPGRVGLLRGAGNAIVPQVAAEFIKAF